MSVPLLEIDRLNVHFGRMHAVQDVSLTVNRGEKLAIIGESGSGKSVTAMSVMRLLGGNPHTTGAIRLAGQELLGLPEAAMHALRGGKIAMVFQDPMTSLNPTFTVGRQICDVLAAHDAADKTERMVRAQKLLDEVGIQNARRCLTLYPHELSGGMRQRVMIALAIACNPLVMIADEPTTALDVTVQEQIIKLLVSLCEDRGIGLLFISHNIDLVGEFADRIAVMHQGRVIETGTAQEVMGAPRESYTRKLIAAIPRIPKTAEPRADSVQAHERPCVLEARDVSKSYPLARSAFARMFDQRVTTALLPSSLKVFAGEILGVVGESGSGKSTLARILIGLDGSDTGVVLLNGRSRQIRVRKDRMMLSREIQLVFQGSQSSLNPRKTMRHALREAMRPLPVEQRRTPEELMQLVRLDPALLERYPHQLSGGQRQRVGIARALSTRPSILIADEPTSALDVSVQKEIIELLQSLQRDLGMTMVIISHDLGLIGTICNRVAVMQSGAIVEQGEAGALLNRPQTSYTQSLLDSVPKGLSGRGRFALREKT